MTKLKQIRSERGISQSQLAEKANMNVRTLQHYEQGHRGIEGAKLDTLIDIAQVLKCKVSDILNDPALVEKCKEMGI